MRFLVMELVAGEDLSRRLDRGPLPVNEALRVGLQVTEALEAAHDNGVIHRDLKPANIQLTPTGEGQGARLRSGQGVRRRESVVRPVGVADRDVRSRPTGTPRIAARTSGRSACSTSCWRASAPSPVSRSPALRQAVTDVPGRSPRP